MFMRAFFCLAPCQNGDLEGVNLNLPISEPGHFDGEVLVFETSRISLITMVLSTALHMS